MNLKAVSIITAMGNIELPDDILEELNWKIGDVIEIYMENNSVVLRLGDTNHKYDDCYVHKSRRPTSGGLRLHPVGGGPFG